jgi:hypothetical protein
MSIFPVSFILIAIGFTIFALIIMKQMLKKKEPEFKTIKNI